MVRAGDSDNAGPIWEFPKIRGAVFWCPYKKDPTI